MAKITTGGGASFHPGVPLLEAEVPEAAAEPVPAAEPPAVLEAAAEPAPAAPSLSRAKAAE